MVSDATELVEVVVFTGKVTVKATVDENGVLSKEWEIFDAAGKNPAKPAVEPSDFDRLLRLLEESDHVDIRGDVAAKSGLFKHMLAKYLNPSA